MLPHNDNTISFRCFVLDYSRQICASFVDGTLTEVLTWKAMKPELFNKRQELISKWCRHIMLEIVRETNWCSAQKGSDRSQVGVLENCRLSKSKCRQRRRHKVSSWQRLAYARLAKVTQCILLCLSQGCRIEHINQERRCACVRVAVEELVE